LQFFFILTLLNIENQLIKSFKKTLMSYGVGAREPHVGAKRAKHRAKHERTVLRSKNKGTKCTFVVSEPQHQLWVQWGM
jgi:hypothetical protein